MPDHPLFSDLQFFFFVCDSVQNLFLLLYIFPVKMAVNYAKIDRVGSLDAGVQQVLLVKNL